MPVLKMRFFGPGRIFLSRNTEKKARSRKEFALLAYLAVESDRAHNRETLLGLLWPELSQQQARNNLRVALTRLRNAIKPAEPTLLKATRLTVEFDADQLQPCGNAWLDVLEFERLLSLVESHNHADPTQCNPCLNDMVKASELYQDEFLSGFNLDGCEAFEHWLLIQRERYHMQVMHMLPQLEEAYLSSQNWRSAEKIVRQRLALDPLNESAHRSLMNTLARSGLRNAALAHYKICVRTLKQELGVSPAKETTDLIAQIRNGNLQPDLDEASSILIDTKIVNQNAKSTTLDPHAILTRLEPLPNQKLFGITKAENAITKAINTEGEPWLISIEGIGGLGKTTLANAVVKELINNYHQETDAPFANIAWVSAKQEEYLPNQGVQATGKAALDAESLMDQLLAQLALGPYPIVNLQEKRLALTQLLKEKPHLIVIDNLETAIDYQALLPLLRHLSNPTKFLITSRVTLSGQGDFFCYSLAELTATDALAFLRHEATTRGMSNLIATTDEQLYEIHKTVGGNPLALKLVLSQIHFLPLSQVLESLHQANSTHSMQLYTYIYQQSWQMLDTTNRHLLLCLPIVPNATFAQLQTISGLETARLQTGLMNLRSLSLVEVSSDLTAPRYRLHRLTESFLMHEVIKWQNVDHPVKSTENIYFMQRLLYMVQQWNKAEAVHKVDVNVLDHEYESVVKAISLGLEVDDSWQSIKPLIIAFIPFMERRGHWHTGHSILERAVTVANHANDLDGEITLTALLARLCQRESRPTDVVYHYRRVIRMARRSDNRFEEARACSNLGFTFIEAGQWWRAEILSCHAMEIFEKQENAHGRAHTYNHLGILYTRQSKWKDAQQYLTMACKIWEEKQDNHSLINGYTNLGLMFTSMGNSEEALKHLSNAHHITETTGELSISAGIWNNMAFAHRLNLDWGNANKYAYKAEKAFRKAANFSGLAAVWNNLGLIALGSGNHAKALEYLEESLKLYQKLNNQIRIATVQKDLEKVVAQSLADEATTPFGC